MSAAGLAIALFTTGALAGPTATSAATQLCTSSTNPALAARISADIKAVSAGRASRLGIHVDDPSLRLSCSLNGDDQFYAASTVKVLILAALLHKAEQRNRPLTAKERSDAQKMIEVSNNYAAGVLWYDVGRKAMRNFLALAGMSGTILGSTDYWGLTEESARDESRLLHLLASHNSLITTPDREYALDLMAHVVSSQRWGTPAGVAPGYVVHVKNGWLPLSGYKWIVSSLGVFTRGDGDYTMDVLTDGNGTMGYGVTTIEKIAHAVNRDLKSVTSP